MEGGSMNTLHLWMGIAIGTITALLIILAIIHFAGNANAEKAKVAGDRNFAELQRRNNIGDSQVNALWEIATHLAKQNNLIAPSEDWDDLDDDDEDRVDKLAEMKRKKESWQAETIRLENELIRVSEERNALTVAAESFIEGYEKLSPQATAAQIFRPTLRLTKAAISITARRAE
jgi:hypothetical protein